MLTEIEIYGTLKQKSTFDLCPVCARLGAVRLVSILTVTISLADLSGKVHAGTEIRTYLLSRVGWCSGTIASGVDY